MIMDKIYSVTIFSIICTNNKQISKCKITVPCEFKFRNKPYLIAYKESIDGIKFYSTIKVYNDNLIVVSRKEDQSIKFIFEKNKNHKCDYITKLGLIEMEIFTHEIKSNFEQDSCYIELDYSIGSNGLIFSKNKIVINVKEETNNV